MLFCPKPVFPKRNARLFSDYLRNWSSISRNCRDDSFGRNRNGIDKAYQILALPEKKCFPVITLILGYAREPAKVRRGRIKDAGVVHYGRYERLDEEGLDRMIAEYDDPEKEIGMFYGYEREGFNHYLDWFFVKWLGGFPVGTGDAVKDRLEKSGYLHIDIDK